MNAEPHNENDGFSTFAFSPAYGLTKTGGKWSGRVRQKKKQNAKKSVQIGWNSYKAWAECARV